MSPARSGAGGAEVSHGGGGREQGASGGMRRPGPFREGDAG